MAYHDYDKQSGFHPDLSARCDVDSGRKRTGARACRDIDVATFIVFRLYAIVRAIEV